MHTFTQRLRGRVVVISQIDSVFGGPVEHVHHLAGGGEAHRQAGYCPVPDNDIIR